MPLQIEDHILQGEFARIAKEVNGMVKQLNLFSREVTPCGVGSRFRR